MRLLRLLAAALLSLPLAAPAQPPRGYTAVVTHVSDGDTIWVRPTQGGRVQVRLQGIDAPEICQRFGEQSRRALEQLVLRKRVFIEERGRDDFGRVIAHVRRSGEDVGSRMVANGMAWSPGFRRQPGPYDALQSQARQERRGLWAGAHPLEPRTFRRLHGPCEPASAKL
jgi:micrococcal nuclease